MRAEPSLATTRAVRRCGAMSVDQKLPVPVSARARHRDGGRLPAGCGLRPGCGVERGALCGQRRERGAVLRHAERPLSRNLGRKEAFEMLVTGEFISAQEARKGTGQPGGPARRTRRGRRDAGGQHRCQAPPGARFGQGPVLPPAGNRHRGRAGRRQPDHGLQHDGRERAGRRSGLHREAPARLEALEARCRAAASFAADAPSGTPSGRPGCGCFAG